MCKGKCFPGESLIKTLPELDHLERKKIFASLVRAGLLLTEKKTPEIPDSFGNQYPYTVFTIDEKNRFVRELRKSRKTSFDEGKSLLSKAAAMVADVDGKVLGSKLGIKLREINPEFVPMRYGFIDLSLFVDNYPEILVFEGERSGGDMIYRLLQH